jgi:hypothetical protein
MYSPPGFQFLSRISIARGAIPGNLARSWRLWESVREEKNIKDEFTIGPRSLGLLRTVL